MHTTDYKSLLDFLPTNKRKAEMRFILSENDQAVGIYYQPPGD